MAGVRVPLHRVRPKIAGLHRRVAWTHGFETWNWRELTFKAVAERAGVGERTVYRHFPTERHLRDAVMQRLESEAGIPYEDVNLTNLAETTSRVFGLLQRFSVCESIPTPHDPAFVSSDQRRRDALLRAVSEAAPAGSASHQRMIAGLLDVLWSPACNERRVGVWDSTAPTPPARSNG